MPSRREPRVLSRSSADLSNNLDTMMIVIVDIHPPHGMSFSRAYEAADMIRTDIPVWLPDLRLGHFFAEIRKLLLYSRYHRASCHWDDQRLNRLEPEIGFVDIRARYPNRWSVSKPLTAQLAVEIIEQALLEALPVIKFYVDWYPYGPIESAVRIACKAEERVSQFLEPYLLELSSRWNLAVQPIRKQSARLPWARRQPEKIASSENDDRA